MKRIYEAILKRHLSEDRQMIFLTGPRQVGKTTCARALGKAVDYLTWDSPADRTLIVMGADVVAAKLGLQRLATTPRLVIFDELHKYAKWKNFLKGFFDVYGGGAKIVVTGSARLGFFKRGGDSLMGRYFSYRMHPLSVGELVRQDATRECIRPPKKPQSGSLARLLDYGGFPEPFLRESPQFASRWRRLRGEQLFQGDLRDLSLTLEVAQIEVLATLLANQAGQLLNFSTLARDINVSVDTVKRWITLLESLFYCYRLRPWFANVPKSLRKQPKVFLWDWSRVKEAGARRENFIASHLLKAVQGWTDQGLGEYDLFYLRDKMKREVDFLVTRDGSPWFLIEAKSSASAALSPSLAYFQKITQAEHAFQVVFDLPFVSRSAFDETRPIIVPAETFLTQLF